ncbi:hypothetical protein FA13DRAFT_271792 [Coprinellus micaceus]|uniref:Uncharacterized protein n=1 Tax=Coprinellus micaceus TaxID=71717 RepID=A0A4Y7SEV1_COPMI|nr:hypothetical protein FA13DRAFT_271792 [Coprinellus micaceus]
MVGSVVKSGVVELPATSSDSNEEEGEGKGKGKEKAKEKEKKKGDEKNPQNPTNDPWNNVFPPLPRPLSSRVPGSSSWFPVPDAYEYDLLPRGWRTDFNDDTGNLAYGEVTTEEAEMMLAADAEAERQAGARRRAVPVVSLTEAERARIGAQIEDGDIAERVARGFYHRAPARGPRDYGFGWGRRRVYAVDSEDEDDSEDDYGLGDGGFGVEEEDEGEEEFTDSEEEEEYLRDLDLVFGGARAAAARRYRRRGGPAVRVGGANANAGGGTNANPGPNATLNDNMNAIANANLRARLPTKPEERSPG